jgi:hypothetical protein
MFIASVDALLASVEVTLLSLIAAGTNSHPTHEAQWQAAFAVVYRRGVW